MSDAVSLRNRAIVLMRAALALLDRARDDTAACHLQAALDTAERVPPLRHGEALPDETASAGEHLGLVADPALVSAIGGALAIIATVLARQGATTVEELANLFGLYAVAGRDVASEESLLLGCWGGILREVAGDQRSKI